MRRDNGRCQYGLPQPEPASQNYDCQFQSEKFEPAVAVKETHIIDRSKAPRIGEEIILRSDTPWCYLHQLFDGSTLSGSCSYGRSVAPTSYATSVQTVYDTIHAIYSRSVLAVII